MRSPAADHDLVHDSGSMHEVPPGFQSQPLIPEVGVIGVVPDEWDAPWQSRHHVLTRLARYFNVVWYGLMRDRQGLWGRSISEETRPGPPGFVVYRQDKWLPVMYRPAFLAEFTERLRLARAHSILRRGGSDRTIMYHWRPKSVSMLDEIEPDLNVYHIDDEYSFSNVEQPISANELDLITRVDQVFIHSPALMEKKGRLNTCVEFTPNGVDYTAYSTPATEALDMQQIPHPRIGYIGRVKPQLDLGLLLELSNRHPGWSFVLVGPIVSSLRNDDPKLSELRQQPNVYFLGNKPVEQLPAYNQHFDVSIMCYKVDDYTKYIYPMKLHEYLATGLPVVGSPIRSLQEFEGIIRLVSTIDEWSAALSASLAPESNTPRAVEARLEVARKHDWDRIVHHIARTMCERLGPPYPSRFREHTESRSGSERL